MSCRQGTSLSFAAAPGGKGASLRRGRTRLLAGGLLLLLGSLVTVSHAQEPAVRPFKIHVEEKVLEDLEQRLAGTRFPGEIEGAGWKYGTNLAYLKALVAYWREGYDWRKHERALNELPHFKTEIDGLDLHFVHVRSKEPDALPLVITHGWPGSFYEFMDVIGPLTDPAAHGGRAEDAFHLVLPSMPGYGYSGKPREPGYTPRRIASVIAELMARLGYGRYGAQGGDWGAAVTTALGHDDREHVVGVHLNMPTASPPEQNPEEGVPAEEIERWRERSKWWEGENAYGRIQGTKPQTLGYALNDSPAGLAAWIVEKFRTWSDCGGDVESQFTKDQLLTNIMIYWTNEAMPSSIRLYYEFFHGPRPQFDVEVPTGAAIFPKEIFYVPRKWVEARYNLVHWSEMPRGGHFAAMEEPELFVEDVRKFFRPLR